MPNDTQRAPLSSWARPVVMAVALAYRAVLGKRGGATEAFLAAEGDPEAAARDVVLIVAAVARDPPRLLSGAGAGADRAGGAVVEGPGRVAAAEGPAPVAGQGAGLTFLAPRPVNVRSRQPRM